MSTRRLILLAFAATCLSGCATLSELDCRKGDWQALGLQDGRTGRSLDVLERHRKACEPYGIQPDENLYLLAREQGLRSYCTAANGVDVGTYGRADPLVCPKDLQRQFLLGYEAGRVLAYARDRLQLSRIRCTEQAVEKGKNKYDARSTCMDERPGLFGYSGERGAVEAAERNANSIRYRRF